MLELLHTPLIVLHIFVCLMLMLVVLIQPGKSGGLGAALGGAGAQQIFGGRGAGNFLTRTTWIAASVFFLTSVTLAYLSTSTGDSLEDLANTPAVTAPAPAPSEPPAGAAPSAPVPGSPAAPAPASGEPAPAAPAEPAPSAPSSQP
jgi:preprotein translocase subunit SecG